jgi:hypothetical protein
MTPDFTLHYCSVYSATIKVEAICSSETSADFQRTTWCNVPEDSTLYNYGCENLKSHKVFNLIKKFPTVY